MSRSWMPKILFHFCLALFFCATNANAQSGTLTSDSPCQLALGQANCTVTINWSKSGTPIACLWHSEGWAYACQGYDTYSTSWPYANQVHQTMYLKAHSSWETVSFADPTISFIDIYANAPATPQGNITSNSPCQLAPGQSTCNVTISWTKSNTPVACVWQSNGQVLSCQGYDSSSVVWTGANPVSEVFYLKAHSSFETISFSDPTLSYTSVFASSPTPPPPQCSLTASASNIVAGQSTTLSASCTNSPTSYVWGNASGGPAFAGNGGTGVFSSAGTFGYSVAACNSSGCGAYSNTTIQVSPATVPAYQAAFVNQNVPSTMTAGQTYAVSVTMRNDGSDTWTAGASYKLGSQNPIDNLTWGIGRVATSGQITLGQEVTFSFNVTAPSSPGTYNFQWRMVRDGVTWFGAQTANVSVTIVAPPPASGGNLILNGGFESPVTATYVYPSSIPSWTISAGYPAIQRNGSAFGAATAPEGAQTAVLQNVVTISTTVNVPATGTYSLTFKAAARTNYGGPQSIDAKVNGATVYSVSPSSGSFTQYQTTFNLSAGAQTIALAGTNGVGDNSAFVDDVVLVSSGTTTPPNPRPLIGVIRYDAQGDHEIGQFEERAMGPSQWHSRLPFYATEINASTVRMRMDSQAKMDQEIAYAKEAGIDYWAFDWWVLSQPQSKVLTEFYLKSAHKDDVKWAAIWITDNLYDSDATYLISQFTTSNYQKVAGGRPLVYVYDTGRDVAEVQPRIAFLRNSAMTAMNGTRPYFVAMAPLPGRAAVLADSIGADAVSSYATSAASAGEPYSSSAAAARDYHWNMWRDATQGASRKVIPWVTAGWDPRPRFPTTLNPPFPMYYDGNYGALATPTELVNQLKSAMTWLTSNPLSTEANTVLLYSWNEFSEGGSICPTLLPGPDGTNKGYINAIKSMTFP